MTERIKSNSISLGILILSLTVLACALGILTLLTARAANATDDIEVRRFVGRLAWFSLALLGFTIVLLFWSVVRGFRSRIHQRRGRARTPYVDAWALAGKRFKLEEHPDEDPQERGGTSPEETS